MTDGEERLDLIKAAMLVKALGDGMYKDDRCDLLCSFTGRKKEDFDRLADEIVAMPVGEMQSTIQTYMEKQVRYSTWVSSLDGRLPKECERGLWISRCQGAFRYCHFLFVFSFIEECV